MPLAFDLIISAIRAVIRLVAGCYAIGLAAGFAAGFVKRATTFDICVYGYLFLELLLPEHHDYWVSPPPHSRIADPEEREAATIRFRLGRRLDRLWELSLAGSALAAVGYFLRQSGTPSAVAVQAVGTVVMLAFAVAAVAFLFRNPPLWRPATISKNVVLACCVGVGAIAAAFG